MRETAFASLPPMARFDIVRRLGEGGMGVVYQAFDKEKSATVALKTLSNVHPSRLVRFKREFRALAELHHPNLACLHELFNEGNAWFFTMEYVDGVDLMAYVRPGARAADADTAVADTTADAAPGRRRPGAADPAKVGGDGEFSEVRLRASLAQLAQAVAALHANRRVHRDVKPSNVLVQADGRVVLVDFGLVAELADDPNASKDTGMSLIGTPAYMSPEQAASAEIGPESDWYSVGVVLYQALTGRLPFDGAPIAILTEKTRREPPPPRAFAPDVPADLDRLTVELLRRDPASRPRGDEVLTRLGAARPQAPEIARTSVSSRSHASLPFVGRSAELGELGRALDDARARRTAVTVIVSGESGVGKSALAWQFAARAKAAQAVVLAGRCFERELLPFKAFDGIIDALARHLGKMPDAQVATLLSRDAWLLEKVFPVLGQVHRIGTAPRAGLHDLGPQEARARAFVALRELFGRLAERAAVVLEVDDLHWSDADGLELLREILQPPDAPAVLLLATWRSDLAPATTLLSSLRGDVRTLALERLDADESRQLAKLLSDTIAPGRTIDLRRIAPETLGHPLFLQQVILHALRQSPDDGKGPALAEPLRLEDALWARIESLDAAARRMLDVVSVAGAPLAFEVIAIAANVERGEVDSCAATLRLAHLASTMRGGARLAVGVYHARIAQLVAGRLDPGAKKALHRRIAEALQATSSVTLDPLSFVSHLEAAGETTRAAEYAAREALSQRETLAFDRSAELLRVALRLGAHTAEGRRELLVALGEALTNAGQGGPAADAFLSAAEGAEPTLRRDCLRRAAQQAIRTGHIDRGLEAFRAVLADVGTTMPETPRGALFSFAWQRAQIALRLRWRKAAPAKVDPMDLVRFDVYQAIATSLGYVDFIRGADFQARAAALALRIGDPRRLAYALSSEGITLSSLGTRQAARVARAIEEGRRIAATQDDPFLHAMLACAEGAAAYFKADFAGAVARFEAADAMFREQTRGTAYESATMRLMRLWALRHLGDYVAMRHSFGECVRDAARRGDEYFETTLCRSANAVWLAMDDVASARLDLKRKAWMPGAAAFSLQHWYALRADAEIDLYTGAHEGALERAAAGLAAMNASMLSRIELVSAEVRWLEARLLCARADAGPEEDRARCLSRAAQRARALRKEPLQCAVAWGRLVEATVAHLRGEPERAAEWLAMAEAAAESSKMRLLAAAARARRATVTGGDPGAALESIRALGCENPARMIDVVTPGFSGRKAPAEGAR